LDRLRQAERHPLQFGRFGQVIW